QDASTAFSCNPSATTAIYTLSLHDALPISVIRRPDNQRVVFEPELRDRFHNLAGRPVDLFDRVPPRAVLRLPAERLAGEGVRRRSEEHTSELQSRENLVCRLLLEKKKHYQMRRFQFNLLGVMTISSRF